MSSPDSSLIEQKRNEKDNEDNNTEKTSNWMAFGINVIQNFITTIFIGLIGANFIFLSSSNEDFLEKILPTEFKRYFPSLIKKGGAGGEKYKEDCNGVKKGFNIGNIEALGIGSVGGWPYKLRKEGTVGFFQDFINWIVETIYGAFSINRGFLQKWLSFFSKDNETFLSNDTFQMLFAAPLTLLLSPFVLFLGFFASFYSAFTTNTFFGLIWAIIGLFLGYTWMLTSSISVVQFIQYLLFFIVLPLVSNLSLVKKILHCNIKTLSILFGALVCSSAIANLDYVTSTVMIIVYLIMTIKALL